MSENSAGVSFGHLASALPSPDALVALEAREGRTELFSEVDGLLADVVIRVLHGEEAVRIERGRHSDNVSIAGLSPSQQLVLADHFAVEHQHSKGAWFLPEKVSLKAGLVNLPSIFARYPRFATGLAGEERARVVLGECPTGVFLWSVLEALFERLFLPFELRGPLAGSKSREDQLAAWASVDEIVSALGLDVEDQIAVVRYGGGWSRLRSMEQLEAKQRFLGTLSAQATEELAGRYRAYRLFPLIVRYYSKAKNGRARRKQVLTRGLEKMLSGFFGGDWLRFLAYLGEEPHPDEEIATAIPEVTLYGTTSAATVADKGGEGLEGGLSTDWDTSAKRAPGVASPIEDRVAVLRDFWRLFDAVHSQQATGMPSLWGLVEESRRVRIGWEGPDWYNARLYRRLLPSDLIETIEQLWGSIMLPRWPDRIVSEISPHALMAETLGPALAFWHGCALTAWFVCEGPTSRTDMAGLADYHQDALAQLARLNCTVDPGLFAELREAETRLGAPEPVEERVSSIEVRPGVSVEMRMSTGSRRSGFEHLRDIITRHRRAWTEQFETSYLRARWESELREAARLHSQMIADKGKPPTPKRFARHAAPVTNHWFGGDLSAFYAAIGEKSAVHPLRVSLMPRDRSAFAKRIFERLGGRPFKRETIVSSREEGRMQAEEQDRHTKLRWLAEEGVRFIQLEEVLGRPPELKEFGTRGFEYRSSVLAPEYDEAWERYAEAVDAARAAERQSNSANDQNRAELSSTLPQIEESIPPPPRADREPPSDQPDRREAALPTPKQRQLAGLAKALERRRETAQTPVVRITNELREWDVPDEGEVDIWWRGYDLHDENNRGWTWDDPALSGAGVFVTKVAGVEHYKGMWLDSVGAGRLLRLVPEPENQYDPSAVAIWDAAGREKIGHLPREVAAVVSKGLEADEQLKAMCIAELIRRPGDIRIGLRVLVAPPGIVEGWPHGD